MIRPHFVVASLSLLTFPLLDAAIKGTVVLLLACAVCLLLHRDSAATRHLVWATAVLLLLAMPLLSISLPEWRVLPNWSQTSLDVESPSRSRPPPAAQAQPAEAPRPPHLLENDAGDPGQLVQSPLTVPPRGEQRPALLNATDFNPGRGPLATIARQPAALVTIAWLAGCMLVLLRLLIAVVLLRKSASRCRVLAPLPADSASAPHDRCTERSLRAALDAAAARLNVKRSVQLLLDSQPSMPVVWGLLRSRMRLPAEAVNWSLQQQRSVLLHELAHIRRHDLVVLTMTQFACALNWFNPLMWFAAWRLGVERERACDDLVLASGVRPSAYAGHLLDVVTGLAPARWTQSCGLAMARQSSLEGRLVAVLSENLNRRGVPVAIAGIALVIAVGIAVPIAMLRAAEEKPAEKPISAKTGEPLTDTTRAERELKFPPPKPEAVRGLDLSTVAVRGYESAYRSLPDLFGPYSEKPWSGSYPKNLFQMPLAEHTWLKYPAGSGHFYIQHRHDGTAQSEQIYGPIEGDPFDVLKLEELLREQMKPGATSGDPRYRLRLMFRNGEPGLVRRAWRMIEPELAFKFTQRDENFFQRFELFEGVRDALRDRADAFLNPELKDIVAQAKRRIEAAEVEFDELNGFGDDMGDDDRYQSVTYLQPKIAAKIPELLWGKPLDGLRLGLVPREGTAGTDWNELPIDTALPTSITVEPGQEQRYQLVVENVSDHDIRLCGYFLGEERHRTLEVLDRNGKLVETQGLHTSTPSSPSFWRLKPGERHLLSMPAVHFMPAQSNDPNQGLGYFVKTAPGEYTLRCSYRFGLYDNGRHRHIPAKGVWVGPLTTGSQRITFTDPGGAKDRSTRAERRQESQKSKEGTSGGVTVLLTPDNVAEYDYFFVCGVLNEGEKRRVGRTEPVAEKVDAFLRSLGGEKSRVGPTDPVVVYLRFAPKRKGIYVLRAEDLKAITAVSLLVRDGDAVLNVPLRTEVDPGNYVHLHARFSAQKKLLPKMQLMFEEHGDAGKRTFLANLKDFIEER